MNMTTDNIQDNVSDGSIKTSEQQTPATANNPRPLWKKIIKVTLFSIMGIVLFVAGLLMATLTTLQPERLTPLINAVANSSLRADVSVGRAELSYAATYPYLTINADNISITSRDTKALDEEYRSELPEWTDTLLTVKNLHGGINVGSLLGGTLSLSDVVIDAPHVNIVIVDDETTNFNITEPSQDTTAFDFASLPTIDIKRFEITNPGPVRFYNNMMGSMLQADFTAIQLSGEKSPLYRLDFNGNIDAPVIQEWLSLDDLRIGLNGDIRWAQSKPTHIALDNFAFELAIFKGTISTDLDFGEPLTINSLDLKLAPLSLATLLRTIPEDLTDEYEIPRDINTNAILNISTKLKAPYKPDTDALPLLEAQVDIPTCMLKWRDIDFRSLETSVLLNIPSQNLDDMTIDVKKLNISGPATDISIKGTFTNLISDPHFNSDINTDTDLRSLPPTLRKLFPGTISGQLTAKAHVEGNVSMFSPTGFQRLMVDGDVGLRNFHWASDNTVNTLYVDRALFKFGTQKRVAHNGSLSAPLLSASIEVDTIAANLEDLTLNGKGLTFGVASKNERPSAQAVVHPMGGGVKIARLDMVSLADSVRLKLREIDGTAIVRPYEGDVTRPQFIFDLAMRRFSSGDNTSRVSINRANLHLSAYRKPETARQRLVRLSADSLRRHHPSLDIDSVITLAEQLHPRVNRHRRDNTNLTDDNIEVIDFGMSKGMRRLLNRWVIDGSLTSKRARLYTPYFPLRNKFSDIDFTFNNDSINITKVGYQAGRTDLELSGNITNLRRALTSRKGRQPLKIRLFSHSDTIDVNQLATAAFAGSAYSANDISAVNLGDIDDDNDLDAIINNQTQNDSTAPLLIPQNIDLELGLCAHNVLYSDLLLHNMTGDLMAYKGALNLHQLEAHSDVGCINMSALYLGSNPDSLSFGFGLNLEHFDINRFLKLVPAVDSIMPVLRNFSGVISADIAATTPIDQSMNLRLSQLNAAIKLTGDQLVLLDPETFKTVSKWLFFKNKNRNIIDHMAIEMAVNNGALQVYPFIFDFDRYRLGVQGHNDFALNFDYHIAVLKSPVPFKFGINIKGNPDKMKVRLGRAKLNEKMSTQTAFVDTTRVNLLRQIENVFRRGVRDAGSRSLHLDHAPRASRLDNDTDTLSAADSLQFYKHGLIDEKPEAVRIAEENATHQAKGKKNKKQKQSKQPTDKSHKHDNTEAVISNKKE